MFYLMAGNIDLGDDYTAGVLAHEFQHMIHWYRDTNEDTWMNEGFSVLAEHLNDFDIGGFDFAYAVEPDQALSHWPGANEDTIGHYGQAFSLAYSTAWAEPPDHRLAPGQRVRLDRPGAG
jgi:hypothetical protein